MEDQVRIDGHGRQAWRVENRQQHFGLDAEYLPAFLTGETIQKTLESLKRANFVSAVRSSTDGGGSKTALGHEAGTYYAWYADRGDWELQLFLDQQNAFQPMSPCEWMRAMSHRLMTEVPSFDNTDRTFGGATGLLVSWCPWPHLGVPVKRTGEHARDWAAWQTTIFVYLSDGKVGDDAIHEIRLSPSQYPGAQKHFESDEIKRTKQKSISFQMQHGSVLILRGKESHSCWDMTHSPSRSSFVTADGDNGEMVRLDTRGYFFLEFESIHPLRFLNEKRLRPAVRVAEAIDIEKRLTPLFFHVSEQKPPAVIDLNEQPPPPPPKAIETERPGPASPLKKKKKAPAKKRARPAPKKKVEQEDEDEK
jgi:hypothetical protein